MANERKMKSSKQKKVIGTRTERGAATERILDALAEEYPHVHDRVSFMDSAALAKQFGKKPDEKLSEMERISASRTLGRLIGEGTIRETLFLAEKAPRIDSRGAGLVSVSINLDRLTQERDAWDQRHEKWKKAGDKSPEPQEPKQETIIENIIKKTRAWGSDLGRRQRVLLVNISIVHGSSDFDLLILVLYRSYDEYMRYIRDVIQRVPFVQKTHTMQIGGWEGFPDIGITGSSDKSAGRSITTTSAG